MEDSIVIKVCGSAGDGSISAVEILNRAVASMGYHIMNFDSYPAEIRGFGKSCGMTRISRERALTPGDQTTCLVSLNDPHGITELPTLSTDAVIVFDSRPPGYVEEDQAIAGFIEPGMIGYGVPLRDLSVQATRNTKARNIVALGIIAGLFHLSREEFRAAIERRFAVKPESVRRTNLDAFQLGYDYVIENPLKTALYDFKDQVFPREGEMAIISGNEAVAQACIDSGIRLFAGYPITPATRIMEILAKELPRNRGVLVQTEDEISAVSHVIGGGFAGTRAATATSGPGFCLMTEAINLAVMAEIPAVIIDCQRGGPSTGLPTKTEQSDLNLAVFGASGDSPRIVLAPTCVEECYSLTKTAFELAESYQTPVIVLLDFFLSNRIEDIDESASKDISWGSFTAKFAVQEEGSYRRFRLTADGISPRAYPGMHGFYHAVTGLEHNELGRPDYQSSNHLAMNRKRIDKIDGLAGIFREPEEYGDTQYADIGIISWGSTVGSSKEAIDTMRGNGMKAAGYFPRLMFPFQTAPLMEFSRRCRRIAVAEVNSTGQYASMIGRFMDKPVIPAWSAAAEPVRPGFIVDAVKGIGS